MSHCEQHPNLTTCHCRLLDPPPVPQSVSGRARPTTRGYHNSREHFEKLMYEITGCRTGDGTLEVKRIHVTQGLSYANPHTQYMWERYQAK